MTLNKQKTNNKKGKYIELILLPNGSCVAPAFGKATKIKNTNIVICHQVAFSVSNFSATSQYVFDRSTQDKDQDDRYIIYILADVLPSPLLQPPTHQGRFV